MKPVSIFILIAGAALVSCGSTKYVPLTEHQHYGYEDVKIDSVTWFVQFRGNFLTSSEIAYRYCLYRAAELTLEHDFDKFAILSRSGGETFGRPKEPTLLNRPKPEKPTYPGGYKPWTPPENINNPPNLISESFLTIRLLRSVEDGMDSIYDARKCIAKLSPAIAKDN